jgi:hypothetical protein
MMLRIGIEEPPDHALVLRVMFSRLTLEELDASLAQRDGDFDAFVSKDEFLWARKEVRNDPEVSERFVGILDFLAHRFSYLSANSQPENANDIMAKRKSNSQDSAIDPAKTVMSRLA